MRVEVLILSLVGAVLLMLGLLYRFAPQLFGANIVSAVYRQAIKTAEATGGIEWLVSTEGIAYRRSLVARAYALAPSPLFGVPWKFAISEALFCRMVEKAFMRTVRLAEQLAH